MANASSRASAEALLALGFTVWFVYPSEPGTVYRKTGEIPVALTSNTDGLLERKDGSWEHL